MVAVREGRQWEYAGPADRERCHISGECAGDRCVGEAGGALLIVKTGPRGLWKTT